MSAQNRVSELVRKFPSISAALAIVNEGVDTSKDVLHITVARMDEDLLGNVALLCDGKRTSLCDPGSGLLGSQHQLYLAVDANHNIVGRIGAVKADEELRDKTQLRFLLLDHLDSVHYVLRVTVTSWCIRIKDWLGKDSPHGELQRRDVNITVHRAPEQGLKNMLSGTWTDDNFRLHFRNPFDAPMKNPDAMYFSKRLVPSVRSFEQRTFFNGFKDSLPAQCFHKEFQLGDITYSLSSWDNGKKIRVRFERGDVMLGIAYDGADYLMVDSIDATVSEARTLLEAVTKEWHKRQMQEIAALWKGCVEVTLVYFFRLADQSVSLAEALPGVRIVIQDADLFVVEIPETSKAALEKLELDGKIPNPTNEEVARLKNLLARLREESQ